MTDATSHDIMSIEVEEDDPPTSVPLDTLRSGLTHENNLVRVHAAKVAAGLSAENVDQVKAVLPELVEGLDDERRVVTVQCLIALYVVAEDEPERIEPAIADLIELLDADLDMLRSYASRVLGLTSVEHPEYVAPYIEDFVAAMHEEPEPAMDRERLAEETPDPSTRDMFERYNMETERRQMAARGIAANLAVEVADHDHTLAEPYVDEFVTLLDETDLRVVNSCVDILGIIGREDADAVAEAVESLCDLLEHENEALVGSTVQALGYIGDRRAVGALRELADDEQNRDRDADLREMAAETAEFIEAGPSR